MLQCQAVEHGVVITTDPVREPVQVGLVVGLDPVDPRVEAFAVSADL